MDDVCFASAFEVCLSRHHDFMTAFGFYLVMQCVRRLATHSHMWVGVPCSTWVWMSRGSTRRCRLRARGSKKVRCVKVAKHFHSQTLLRASWLQFIHIYVLDCFGTCCFFMWHTACSVSLFGWKKLCSWLCRLELVRKKGAYWTIEQPSSSLLPFYVPFKELAAYVMSCDCVAQCHLAVWLGLQLALKATACGRSSCAGMVLNWCVCRLVHLVLTPCNLAACNSSDFILLSPYIMRERNIYIYSFNYSL